MNKDQSTDRTWTVRSETGTDTYTVKQDNEECPHNCLLRCRLCTVCIHQYSCTCLDSLTRSTMCKHVHLVVRTRNTERMKIMIPKSQQLHTQSESEMLNFIRSRQTIDGNTLLKDQLFHKLSTIKQYIMNTNDKEGLLALNKQLDISMRVFNKQRQRGIPANKSIIPP